MIGLNKNSSAKKTSSSKGFTLIELLVVISIIGLLASIVLVALNNARIKSRDAKRAADVVQLQKALELYLNQNGSYPNNAYDASSVCTGQPSAPTDASKGWACSHDTSGSWSSLQTSMSGALAKLPVDPAPVTGWPGGAGKEEYYYYSDGCFYMIVFSYEQQTNVDNGQLACSSSAGSDGIVAANATTTPLGKTWTGVSVVGSRNQ